MIFNDIEKYHDVTALIDSEGVEITYKSLIQIAAGFGDKVPSRTIVLLICENSIESIASYFGFIRSGIVPILIDNKTSIEFVENLQKIYKIKYICAQKSYLESYSELLGYKYNTINLYGNYSLVEFEEDNYHVHDDLALLLPTSGSTGSPKFVQISYKNLYSNTKSISESLPINSVDVAITTMPMSYSYGLSIINTHLFNGASILVTNKSVIEKEFWHILARHNVTTFGGVPFIYSMLKRLKFSEMKINSLKYITQAGGQLDPLLVKYFIASCKKMGIDFYVMYGQTEATARMSVLSADDISSKTSSIGKAIPGGKFSLVDEMGNEIDGYMSGELVYYGDNVSMGYAKNYSDLKNGDINKGKLHTGDIAKRDDDGFYYIFGRKNRFVKVFGVRVGLDDIENFLRGKGIECACSGSDDDLKIYILNPDLTTRVKEIISKTRLVHHRGYSIHCIDSIPRNESGKVIYSHLI